MAHVTEEELVELAERVVVLPPEAELHLLNCDECRDDAEAYRAVGAALRDPIALEHPPGDLWTRIAAELAEPPAGSQPPPIGESPILRSADNRWIRRIAFAAAASFALGVASTAVLGQFLSQPRAEVIQSIGLAPLPGWSDEGTATLQALQGETVLVIDLPESEMDGFREVWLIDRTVERLVSLGAMVGNHAEFTVPHGLDLSEYVIVDVSREHFDGDPTHSGDSIARGQLS